MPENGRREVGSIERESLGIGGLYDVCAPYIVRLYILVGCERAARLKENARTHIIKNG